MILYDVMAPVVRKTCWWIVIKVAGPIDLGDGQVHRYQSLVDPALYVDRSVEDGC